MIRYFICCICAKTHITSESAINCHIIQDIKCDLKVGDIVRVLDTKIHEINGDSSWVYKTTIHESTNIFDLYFVISKIEKTKYLKYIFIKYYLSTNAFDDRNIQKTGFIHGNYKKKIIKVYNPPTKIKKESKDLLGKTGLFNII